MNENVCISKRASEVTPFLVMDILEAAHRLEAQGHSVIHLEIGEPDFDTPECIKEAAKKAWQRAKRTTHTAWVCSPCARPSAKTCKRVTASAWTPARSL